VLNKLLTYLQYSNTTITMSTESATKT